MCQCLIVWAKVMHEATAVHKITTGKPVILTGLGNGGRDIYARRGYHKYHVRYDILQSCCKGSCHRSLVGSGSTGPFLLGALTIFVVLPLAD